MDSDLWRSTRLSSSSRRYQTRSELFFDEYDEVEEDFDSKGEFLCPFCGDEFDIVGLCCHIDEEHPVEVKNGVCPACAKKVGLDIVGHILQHGNLYKMFIAFPKFVAPYSSPSNAEFLDSFKMPRKPRFRRGGSSSAYSILRKELREGNMESFFEGSLRPLSSSRADPDRLLSSFMGAPALEQSSSVEAHPLSEASSVKDCSDEESSERTTEDSVSSAQEKEEVARKSKFVQGLLLSTIFDEDL